MTTISQFHIQRQFTAQCLDVPFERRNFNLMAAFFQIGDRWLRYSECYRQIVLRHLNRLTQLSKAKFKNFLICLNTCCCDYGRVCFFN